MRLQFAYRRLKEERDCYFENSLAKWTLFSRSACRYKIMDKNTIPQIMPVSTWIDMCHINENSVEPNVTKHILPGIKLFPLEKNETYIVCMEAMACILKASFRCDFFSQLTLARR